MPGGVVDVAVERGPVGMRRGVRVVQPGVDGLLEERLRQIGGADRPGQRFHDLVAAGRRAREDLRDRIPPPAQADLGEHRLGGDPGRAGDLEVEGVERHQPAAPVRRGDHRRAPAVGIAAPDLPAQAPALTRRRRPARRRARVSRGWRPATPGSWHRRYWPRRRRWTSAVPARPRCRSARASPPRCRRR